MTLANGDQLPTISAKNVDGETVSIGDIVSGSWAVVLFYRGHW